MLHADWSFLEQAYTPHFLGSIGHGFNRNYLFVIDYEAQTITRDENLAADGFLFEVVFAGQGDEKMSTEVEEEILLILGDLYARMMQ